MAKKYGLFNKHGELLAIATSKSVADTLGTSQELLVIPLVDGVGAFTELLMQHTLGVYPSGSGVREWMVAYARIVSLSNDWISPDAGPCARTMLTQAATNWVTSVNDALAKEGKES